MSNTCHRCNRQLAQVERAIGHTCKPTPEYCDKIEADRDAALAMVREWTAVFDGMMASMNENDVEKMQWFMERGIDAKSKAEAIHV